LKWRDFCCIIHIHELNEYYSFHIAFEPKLYKIEINAGQVAKVAPLKAGPICMN
jgi:hypothetical protein